VQKLGKWKTELAAVIGDEVKESGAAVIGGGAFEFSWK